MIEKLQTTLVYLRCVVTSVLWYYFTGLQQAAVKSATGGEETRTVQSAKSDLWTGLCHHPQPGRLFFFFFLPLLTIKSLNLANSQEKIEK